MYANPTEYFASAVERYATAVELLGFARRAPTQEARQWAYREARAKVRAAKTAMRLCDQAIAFEADPSKFNV